MFFNNAALAATALSVAMVAAAIAPAGAAPAGMTAHLAGSVVGFDNSAVTKAHYARRNHNHFTPGVDSEETEETVDRTGPHFDWCKDRYRSYDPGTDTFQPYHGTRRRCLSPYNVISQ